MIGRLRHILASRHTLRAHFWQTSANYVQQVGGLALGVILARILVPDDFGKFAYAGALILIAMLPFNWSLSPSVLASRCEDGLLNAAAWNLAGWTSLCKAVTVIAFTLYFAAAGDLVMAFLIFLNGIPSCAFEFINLLRCEIEADGNFKPHVYSSLLTIFFTVFLSIPLAYLGWGAIALSIPGVPLVIGQWVIYRKATVKRIQRRPQFTKIDPTYFRQGLFLWLLSSAEQAMFRVDKLLLGRWSSIDALGNYNRAYGYTPVAHVALSSLYTNPTIAALGLQRTKRDKIFLLVKSSVILMVAGTLNALFWWLFSDPFVPWLFGLQWEPAIPVFQAFGGLSLCMALYYLPSAVLIHQRRFGLLAIARVMALGVLIGFAWMNHGDLSAVKMAHILQGAVLSAALLGGYFAIKELFNTTSSSSKEVLV